MFPRLYENDDYFEQSGLNFGTDWIEFNDLLVGLNGHEELGFKDGDRLLRNDTMTSVQRIIYEKYAERQRVGV